MIIFIIILLSKAISSCKSIAIITIIVFKLVAARGNINLASGTHFSRDMVGRDGDRGHGRGRGRGRKGRPRHSTGQPLDLHADPYSLVGSSSDTTVPTNGRPPPIATTTPSRQEPQIQKMPTPGVPRSCTQQANEPSNTASHGVQSDPAIVAPSRAGSYGERQTTSNSTQDAQGQGTSTATGHSSISAPKLRYDGAKCWHPPKPGLKRISQVFKENYGKPWLSFDEADYSVFHRLDSAVMWFL